MTSWTRAHAVNDTDGSSQVLAVAAGAHGFVSVGSHNSQPAVWTTTNGRAWKTIVLPPPGGASAGALQQVAINGNRVVALGQATVGKGPAIGSAAGTPTRGRPFAQHAAQRGAPRRGVARRRGHLAAGPVQPARSLPLVHRPDRGRGRFPRRGPVRPARSAGRGP